MGKVISLRTVEGVEWFEVTVDCDYSIHQFNHIQCKDELRLSPNGRLCGIHSAAQIESASLAKEYASILEPNLQKKYGEELKVKPILCGMGGRNVAAVKRQMERIALDSHKVRELLAKKS